MLCDTEEVINELLKFKDESRIPSKTKLICFTEEFEDVIVNRYRSGFSMYSIAKDLQLSTSKVQRVLKKAGVTIQQKGNEKENYYTKIDWDKFDCCPNCHSKKDVRVLGLHNHSYCLSCGTEWYEEDNEVRKILWHEIS